MADTTQNTHAELDAVSGQTTTGHSWDGIRELNTPLPRWWLWTFYLTILWSIGYWIVYPAWPLVSSHTKGLLGYSSRAAVAEDIRRLEERRDQQAAVLRTADLEQIGNDPTLLRLAVARGKAAFGDNCAGCHGLGGVGGNTFPNLTDDEWIWGGTLADISTTINHGIRWDQDNNSRVSQMLAFGRTGILKPAEIGTVVEYVRSLAGLDVANGTDLAAGAKLYADNCASCHGDQAKGNKDLGAPDLTDAIWLYGSSRAAMVETVTNGRGGVMPAWSGRLDPVTIKALTVYVHSLGGGQK
ncbi:MAG: cytochrome-c oxidase, cbb3-type subunit III [Methylobacterium sp.]|nr:cytochrome-c oxidase, cbb3-type subunit III [Methylobacterium sp.]